MYLEHAKTEGKIVVLGPSLTRSFSAQTKRGEVCLFWLVAGCRSGPVPNGCLVSE